MKCRLDEDAEWEKDRRERECVCVGKRKCASDCAYVFVRQHVLLIDCAQAYMNRRGSLPVVWLFNRKKFISRRNRSDKSTYYHYFDELHEQFDY